MRLNKFIALATGLGRRPADAAIRAGRVSVNGITASLGQGVMADDVVTLDGRELLLNPASAKPTTIMLNKPVGYVVSRDGQGSKTVYDLLPAAYRPLKPIGRLDKYSSGLLLLTNDGKLANDLTHPSRRKVKIYEVILDKPLQPLHQQMITDYGVLLEDGPSKFQLEPIDEPLDARPPRLSALQGVGEKHTEPYQEYGEGASEPTTPRGAKSDGGVGSSAGKQVGTARRLGVKSREKWQVTMREGRNRQIRRTFKAIGYTVTNLHRIQFGSYALNGLPAGQYVDASSNTAH